MKENKFLLIYPNTIFNFIDYRNSCILKIELKNRFTHKWKEHYHTIINKKDKLFYYGLKIIQASNDGIQIQLGKDEKLFRLKYSQYKITMNPSVLYSNEVEYYIGSTSDFKS